MATISSSKDILAKVRAEVVPVKYLDMQMSTLNI